MVAPWKVERGQIRGKKASSVGRSQGKQPRKMMTWMKARLPRAKKRHPTIIFLQASLKSFLRHAEQLKMTLVYEKGKADLGDFSHIANSAAPIPRLHPLYLSAHPSHRQRQRHPGIQRNGSEAAAEGRRTLQSPASVKRCKRPPCAPAAVGMMAAEEGTAGRKNFQQQAQCQAGRWALGQQAILRLPGGCCLPWRKRPHGPLASQAGLCRTPVPSPEPGTQEWRLDLPEQASLV